MSPPQPRPDPAPPTTAEALDESHAIKEKAVPDVLSTLVDTTLVRGTGLR
jgi:hypothetical protein